MLTTHDQPPFSVADKLADPRVLEKYGRIVEVRLLAIGPEHRNRLVLSGLFSLLYEHRSTPTITGDFGYVEQAAMYHKLGFHDLGPPVTSGKAQYIPMAGDDRRNAKARSGLDRTLDRWMKQAAAKQ